MTKHEQIGGNFYWKIGVPLVNKLYIQLKHNLYTHLLNKIYRKIDDKFIHITIQINYYSD